MQTKRGKRAVSTVFLVSNLSIIGPPIKSPIIENNPTNIQPGRDLSSVNFPLLTASSEEYINKMLPWSNTLINGD